MEKEKFFIKLWKIDTNQEYGIHITDYGLDIETWIWKIVFYQEAIYYSHEEGCHCITDTDELTFEYTNLSDRNTFINTFLSIENKYYTVWNNS